MRARDGTEKVEYLRGLAYLHYMMREHQCRYGFILTEAELVVVQNSVLDTPYFGFLEVTCCQPATDASNLTDLTSDGEERSILIAPCLALWGLCMLASDEPLPEGHAPGPRQPKGITKIRHRCPCVRDSVRAVVSLVTNLIYREFTAKDANLSPFCRADKVLL
jgi:hypothetical protein